MRDNIDLLDRMMKDMVSAPAFYRPTNYWQTYEPVTIKYLKDEGLENFRSYDTCRLASFGAGTYRSEPLRQRYKNLIDYKGFGKSSVLSTIFEIYTRIFDRLGKRFDLFNIKKFFTYENYYLQEFEEFKNLQYRHSKFLDTISGLNILDSIKDSGFGHPYDLFQINGKLYTLAFLRYFDQMAYMKMHIDVSSLKSIIEIGSGYGGFIEVFVKSFPHITYFNFDIAPQLYVAQQYLSAVFPGQVYTYENFLSNEKIEFGKYRIFCLPTWALETIPQTDFDLFINSASFQEMEPKVVKNYYSLIKDKVKYAYLFELANGSYKKTSDISGGCVEPLKLKDYISIFEDFKLINMDDFHRTAFSYVHLILKRV
jgi:putative sugar O-methyltransferase